MQIIPRVPEPMLNALLFASRSAPKAASDINDPAREDEKIAIISKDNQRGQSLLDIDRNR